MITLCSSLAPTRCSLFCSCLFLRRRFSLCSMPRINRFVLQVRDSTTRNDRSIVLACSPPVHWRELCPSTHPRQIIKTIVHRSVQTFDRFIISFLDSHTTRWPETRRSEHASETRKSAYGYNCMLNVFRRILLAQRFLRRGSQHRR